MSEDLSILEKIRANAALVVRIASEQLEENIGYDEAGVRWLDGYIQRQHEGGNASNHEGLVNTLGSYLGECIIHSFGGEWAEVEGSWSVRFDDRNAAYPFAKVAKQLENGREDSVLSFFTLIPVLFKGKDGRT
jgi:hypothetical protein